MSIRIKAKQDTLLKKSETPVQSSQLLDSEKLEVKEGTELVVLAKRDIGQEHLLVTFDQPYGPKRWNTWSIYAPHWDGLKPKLNKAKFFPQTDNSIAPLVTCNVSASASLASVYREVNTDEDLLHHVFNVMGYGASTDHNVVNTALRAVYDLDCVFDYNMTWDLLEEILDSGQPVVMGILHKGSTASPYGGHMVCAVEHVGKGKYKTFDPFGSLYDGYRNSVQLGNGVIYEYRDLNPRWCADGPGTGWGRYLRNWRDYV